MIFEDALYPFARRRAGRPDLEDSARIGIAPLQSINGGEPKHSVTIFQNRVNGGAAQSTLRQAARHPPVLVSFQTVRHGEPQAAFAADADGIDPVLLLPFAQYVIGENPLPVTHCPMRRGKPEEAVRLLRDGETTVIRQGFGVDAIENAERYRVETHDAESGPEPKVTVAALMDDLDGVLGQSLLGLPGVK